MHKQYLSLFKSNHLHKFILVLFAQPFISLPCFYQNFIYNFFVIFQKLVVFYVSFNLVMTILQFTKLLWLFSRRQVQTHLALKIVIFFRDKLVEWEIICYPFRVIFRYFINHIFLIWIFYVHFRKDWLKSVYLFSRLLHIFNS